MTQRDLSGWLPTLLGPVDLEANGSDWPSRRKIWNFTGAVVVTDHPNDEDPLLSYTEIAIGTSASTEGPTLANAGTGTLNNVVSTDGSAVPSAAIRFSGVAPSVTGIASGVDERKLVLFATGGPLVLVNESTSSTATNRIITGTGEDVTIDDEGAILLGYDPTSQRWRIVGGVGAITLTGTDKGLLYQSGTDVAGGEAFHTREAAGRIHTHVANTTEGLALTVADLGATGTITRDSGSWVTDGFVVGMLVGTDGFTTAANNVRDVAVTNVTALVLTLGIGTLVAETPASGAAHVYGGGFQTVGKLGGTYPKFGSRRIMRSGNFEGDMIVDTVIDNAGQTIPALAFSDGDAICRGGTRTDANIAIDPFGDGIVAARMIESDKCWAQQHEFHGPIFSWAPFNGGPSGVTRGRYGVVTIDDTPEPLGAGYINGNDGAGNTTTIICVGSTVIKRTSTGTGGTFGYDPSSGFVTGIAATSIEWNQTDLDLGFIEGFADIDGVPTITDTSLNATADDRHKLYSRISTVQTTDATVTTVYSSTLVDEGGTKIFSEANAIQSTGANQNFYERKRPFKRDGGTVTARTQIDVLTDEDQAGWDFNIDNSTSTQRERVTGAGATTITWGVTTCLTETTHA